MSCIDLDTLIIPSFCDVHSLGLTSDQRVTGHLGFTGRGPDCVLFFVFLMKKSKKERELIFCGYFCVMSQHFSHIVHIAQKGHGSNVSKHS